MQVYDGGPSYPTATVPTFPVYALKSNLAGYTGNSVLTVYDYHGETSGTCTATVAIWVRCSTGRAHSQCLPAFLPLEAVRAWKSSPCASGGAEGPGM